MSVQAITKRLFGHEGASNMLWSIAYQLIAIGALFFAQAAWAVWKWDPSYWYLYIALACLGAIFAAGGMFMIETCQTTIPANPPYKAILSIWGERLPVLIDEGDVMEFDYWPLKITYVLVPFKRTNLDFVFDAVPCMALPDDSDSEESGPGKKLAKRATVGGSIEAKVSITIGPDGTGGPQWTAGEAVIKFLNHGGIEGVSNILKDQIGQSLREIAGKYDWETFTFLKEPLTVMLLTRIANINLHELKIGEDGLLTPEMFKLTRDEYQKFPEIPNPTEYLFDHFNPEKPKDEKSSEEQRVEQEIQVFLRIARESCFADVLDLGTEIFRLNVVHLEASAALKKAADDVAKEDKERDSESRDTTTNIKLARMYVDASGGAVDFAKALETVQIDKQRIVKNVHDIQGLEKLLGGSAKS